MGNANRPSTKKVRNLIKLTYSFVINFCVTDSNSDSLIKFTANLMIDLLNSSWNNTSLLVIICKSQHGESLTSTCLTIAHHSTVISSNDTLNDARGSPIIDIILSGVMQNSIELKFPVIKLVVNSSMVCFVNMHIEILEYKENKQINILGVLWHFDLLQYLC